MKQFGSEMDTLDQAEYSCFIFLNLYYPYLSMLDALIKFFILTFNFDFSLPIFLPLPCPDQTT